MGKSKNGCPSHYSMPDRRRKGSLSLPSENQKEQEEGPHIYADELVRER
jgi:hypothetical protein